MTVRITINGKGYTVEGNKTILDVCRSNAVFVPTLCYDERLDP
ncbi:MAG: (2Fe-2S)-binding protein [Nitrospirae bacterium]|nr:(2Fe-2S)-binding protein [Nitrospirota bacterium]